MTSSFTSFLDARLDDLKGFSVDNIPENGIAIIRVNALLWNKENSPKFKIEMAFTLLEDLPVSEIKPIILNKIKNEYGMQFEEIQEIKILTK